MAILNTVRCSPKHVPRLSSPSDVALSYAQCELVALEGEVPSIAAILGFSRGCSGTSSRNTPSRGCIHLGESLEHCETDAAERSAPPDHANKVIVWLSPEKNGGDLALDFSKL